MSSARTIAARQAPPDFSRDVHCVFGLPFDRVTEAAAVERVRAAAEHGRRLFVSTPNLSFAAGCVEDESFRLSVVNSDFSTADGAPIVWLARLMGAPLPERVTGSTVFDRLSAEPGHQVSVYFFGGPEGAAERAHQRLNGKPSPGARSVGYQTPGYGPLEEMCHPQVIDHINQARPEFVVVALGARKGQAWIERNLQSLKAPVVCHLGAVVNFVAGTVQRAPVWVQRSGFEWLWRILEEPQLWRRYWNDGWTFLRYVATGALPWAIFNRRQPSASSAQPLTVRSVVKGDVRHIAVSGAADNGPGLQPLREALQEAVAAGELVALDLREVSHVGTGFVALVQLLDGWQRPRSGRFAVTEVPDAIAKVFRWAGAGYVLPVATAQQGATLGPRQPANT